MAGLRTAAAVSADYDLAHAAYQKALTAESYAMSDGGGSTSVSRARVDALAREMERLDAEYRRLTGGGFIVRGVTPVG